MPTSLKIYPYKMASKSSKALGRALDSRRIKVENSSYRYNPNDLIINWGNSQIPNWYTERAGTHTLNSIDSVRRASNKLRTNDAFLRKGISTPQLTRSNEDANRMLEEGKIVLGRDLIQGSGGRGITVYHPNENERVGEHKYYTCYIKKKREFRIHLGYNIINPDFNRSYPTTIFIQEKKRRSSETRNEENYNSYVRNYTNEWIFAHNDLDPLPYGMVELAQQSLVALGLHFGAVDIIYNAHQDRSYVLEVNTACGMEGETLTRYTNYFNQFLQGE
jgi:hypothetical protein